MKNFKKMKKLAAVVVLTGMVGAAGSKAAYAAGHLPGCNSQLKKVICGYQRTEMAGRHFLYKTSNGTEVYCNKTAATANHDIRCYNSACNVLLGTSYRTCEMSHQFCPRETGLCQY